ncbi:hypothetical protein ACTMU2_18990 [Cupriavidus basilensis]
MTLRGRMPKTRWRCAGWSTSCRASRYFRFLTGGRVAGNRRWPGPHGRGRRGPATLVG